MEIRIYWQFKPSAIGHYFYLLFQLLHLPFELYSQRVRVWNMFPIEWILKENKEKITIFLERIVAFMSVNCLRETQNELNEIWDPLILFNQLGHFQYFWGMIPDQEVVEEMNHLIEIEPSHKPHQLLKFFKIRLVIPQVLYLAHHKLLNLDLRFLYKGLAFHNLQ